MGLHLSDNKQEGFHCLAGKQYKPCYGRCGIKESFHHRKAHGHPLVAKKDGSTWFCVNYRKVNGVTHKDAYPIPRVDDTLDTLSGSTWFSTIDLKSGYWQVEMAHAVWFM